MPQSIIDSTFICDNCGFVRIGPLSSFLMVRGLYTDLGVWVFCNEQCMNAFDVGVAMEAEEPCSP